jgi:GntR family phosphonate transport system transcriptional regulator
LETCPAIASEAAALDLPLGADVHIVEGISLADGQPIALFRSAFPAERLVGFLDQVARDPSITVALAACGVADYTRASTRVTAHLARPIEATALQLGPGAALLRTQAINTDLDGRPIEYGITWFAGERVELTLSSD